MKYLFKPFASDAPSVDNRGLKFSSPLDLILFLLVHGTDDTFWHHRLDAEVILLLLVSSIALQLINLIIAELPSRVKGQIVKTDRKVPFLFSISSLVCSYCLCVSLNHKNVFEIISSFYQTGTPMRLWH